MKSKVEQYIENMKSEEEHEPENEYYPIFHDFKNELDDVKELLTLLYDEQYEMPEEIDDFFTDKPSSWEEFLEEEGTSAVFLSKWRVQTVKSEGGYEGAGEEHWTVVKITNLETDEFKYWEIPGWYASYDGAYLEPENIFEVEPRQVTTKVYEKKV